MRWREKVKEMMEKVRIGEQPSQYHPRVHISHITEKASRVYEVLSVSKMRAETCEINDI